MSLPPWAQDFPRKVAGSEKSPFSFTLRQGYRLPNFRFNRVQPACLLCVGQSILTTSYFLQKKSSRQKPETQQSSTLHTVPCMSTWLLRGRQICLVALCCHVIQAQLLILFEAPLVSLHMQLRVFFRSIEILEVQRGCIRQDYEAAGCVQ